MRRLALLISVAACVNGEDVSVTVTSSGELSSLSSVPTEVEPMKDTKAEPAAPSPSRIVCSDRNHGRDYVKLK